MRAACAIFTFLTLTVSLVAQSVRAARPIDFQVFPEFDTLLPQMIPAFEFHVENNSKTTIDYPLPIIGQGLEFWLIDEGGNKISRSKDPEAMTCIPFVGSLTSEQIATYYYSIPERDLPFPERAEAVGWIDPGHYRMVFNWPAMMGRSESDSMNLTVSEPDQFDSMAIARFAHAGRENRSFAEYSAKRVTETEIAKYLQDCNAIAEKFPSSRYVRIVRREICKILSLQYRRDHLARYPRLVTILKYVLDYPNDPGSINLLQELSDNGRDPEIAPFLRAVVELRGSSRSGLLAKRLLIDPSTAASANR